VLVADTSLRKLLNGNGLHVSMNIDRLLRRRTVASIARILLVGLAVTSTSGHFLAAGQQPTPSPGSKQPAKAPVAIKIELLANRPVVRVRINGQGPFTFLVAPEAEATLIDQTLATELKLKSQGDRSATSQLEVEMEFGASKLLNVTDFDQGSGSDSRSVRSKKAFPTRR
jgi:hypothetical protein